MSYSFDVTASTKDEAKAKVAEQFATVVAQQPNHAKDQAAILANVSAVIDLLADDPEQDIHVDCHGSLNWISDPDATIGVTIHTGAWYVPKVAA
jgi:hypothetical protein